MLLLLLVFVGYCPPTDGSPLEVMVAPSVLRVQTIENIFVEIQDCAVGTNINVQISAMNHPAKNKQLGMDTVALNGSNSCQAFGKILIPTSGLDDNNRKQYVYLQAVFPNKVLEKVVLLSFQSEALFIQTDSNLYTPGNRVLFRIFSMKPDSGEMRTINQYPLIIEILSPEGLLPVDFGFLQSSGIYTGTYKLAENASPGTWKIMAKFSNKPQSQFAAEFEVKEFVMPSLSVKLTPEHSFFYVDGDKLTVNIAAKHLSGAVVDGVAFVLFGILDVGQKQPLPSSLQRVLIVGGRGAATLRREHITQTVANIQRLMGSSIYATVTVLTDNGGDMAEAQLNDIKILTTPYSISLEKTMNYFKPGLPFDLEFQVLNPDNTPAKLVELVVQPGPLKVRTGNNGYAKVPINTEENTNKLTVTIKTNVPTIAHHRQAAATLEALPYTSTSNSYIHIVTHTIEAMVGNNLNIFCFLKRREYTETKVTFLILSKGHLVKHFHQQVKLQTFISMVIPVTKEMLPSFGIVVYFHTSDNKVVADSLWVDAKDSCMGSLWLESVNPSPTHSPRKLLHLKITGSPASRVNLVAVDKGLYTANDRQGLTQKKIWDIVKKYETHCSRGGGKDSMSVFYNAGLLFESSSEKTPYRHDLQCQSYIREKRDVSQGTDKVYGSEYLEHEEIVSRTVFPHTWMWMEMFLPPCPRHDSNCETVSGIKMLPLQDSITNWEIIAISLSPTHGICVAEPLEIPVRKEFSIDLRLPYSALVGEQMEIKAVLHNLSPDSIIVLVHLFEDSNVCSAAYNLGNYQQEVGVQALSSHSVPFVIIFNQPGDYTIEVKATVKHSTVSDGIRKGLQVLPRGELIEHSMTVTLDPVRKGVGSQQTEVLNSRVPLNNMLLNTPASTVVSVTGEMKNMLTENIISGNNMEHMIIQSSGNGETNMVQMTLPVIATMFLDKTNQWETIGLEKRNEALRYIKNGYLHQLAYRKTDGSFAMMASQPGSTWLTAYVAKVFTMVSNLVSIQSSIICDAIKFLIFKTQQPDGSFREVWKVTHGDMRGEAFGVNSEASITSFCLIALQESLPLCGYSISKLPQSVFKAVSYLETRLPQLVNPYAVAITSYALANVNKLNKEVLFRFASSGLNYWPVEKGNIYQLEATAYALLALVKAEALNEARPVFQWLKQQQRFNGFYKSAKTTMMVYQAVTEYSVLVREKETGQYNLVVELRLPGRSVTKYNFNKQNYYVTRTTKSKTLNQDITVKAMGPGRATVKVVSQYFAQLKDTDRYCQKFNLTVQLIPVSTNVAKKVYKLRLDVLYRNKDRPSTMAVLDIGLLTGFTVNTNDLDLLSTGGSRVTPRRKSTTLSGPGSLLVYLDKVSDGQPEEISFRIHQMLEVARLQPAAVSVFEHGDKNRCVRFYHPERKDGRMLQLCRGDTCTCAEGKCGELKKAGVTSRQRIDKSCEVSRVARTDFVYKVRVEEFNGGYPSDVYKMTVLQVVREGNTDVGPEGKVRTFISHSSCRDSLNLEKGKTYLIIGVSGDIYSDPGQPPQYVLSDKIWLEYWPTDGECQTAQHRWTCEEMQELLNQLLVFGCQM